MGNEKVELLGHKFESAVSNLFDAISKAAMLPRPYKKKKIPNTVTIHLSPEKMEILNTISDRIGASRSGVAGYILDAGIYDAAKGCGFTIDENDKIPKEERNWDCTANKFGFSHEPINDKE